MSIQEKFFKFPRVYKLKIAFLTLVGICFRPMFRKSWDVKSIVSKFKIQSVLDIGCGTGNRFEEESFKGLDFFGFDLSFEMIQHASKRYGKRFVVAGGMAAPFRYDSFDLSVLSSVIHHIPLENCSKVISEGARVSKYLMIIDIINSPNRFVRFLKNRWYYIVDGGTKYRTLEEWHELYRNAGVEVLYENYSMPIKHFYISIVMHT